MRHNWHIIYDGEHLNTYRCTNCDLSHFYYHSTTGGSEYILYITNRNVAKRFFFDKEYNCDIIKLRNLL